jgi:hypothetical protein
MSEAAERAAIETLAIQLWLGDHYQARGRAWREAPRWVRERYRAWAHLIALGHEPSDWTKK